MVEAVRKGLTLREVATAHGVSPETVRRWARRAGEERLDRVELTNRPPGLRRAANRTSTQWEAAVLRVRAELRASSVLGEYGAAAIRRALEESGVGRPPSVRTIGRILERGGVLECDRRVRRTPPPRGWYLPDLAAGEVELDSFDVIEELTTLQDKHFEVMTGTSLHGRCVSAWPETVVTAKLAVQHLLERWRAIGLPAYAQFDNDTRFQGPHAHPDTVGRVSRACLGLGVGVVFAPPREHGFQSDVESFNDRWQRCVRGRFFLPSLSDVRRQSDLYVEAHRARHSLPQAAPLRRPFPNDWEMDLRRPLRGVICFLRRIDDAGRVTLMRRRFDVDPTWARRLVRCEVDYDAEQLRIVGLRRSTPFDQPLLRTHFYRPPTRPPFLQ